MYLFRLCFIVFCLFSNLAYCLKIEINRGEIQPEPIAVIDFNNDKIGKQISGIIRNDLQLSGLFQIVGSDIFPEKIINNRPNLKLWKQTKSRFLLHGNIQNEKINFFLIDIVSEKILLNLNTKINYRNIRETAHIIADHVYERITNEAGYFNSQIIFVSTANKNSSKRTTKLKIIDQDGANLRDLTDGAELIISPRYSPNKNIIAYVAYNDNASGTLNKSAHVYLSPIYSQSRKMLLSKSIMQKLIQKNQGMPINITYAPRFSSDGQQVVFAIIIRGSSAIYKLDMASNQLIQLTKHGGIDTSPCFSPDDKQIVFTSDRDGKEALYIMNSDGTNQRKISNVGGKYSQPVWSPRGDLIAFAKQVGGTFYIGVVKPDGTNERLITSGYLLEAPTWASNGRYIAYTAQPSATLKQQIALTDITGRFHRLIQTNCDACSPAWSASYR